MSNRSRLRRFDKSRDSFSNLDFFANGQAGVYHDLQDPSKVFTTFDGSTLSGFGDPMGRVDDSSGNEFPCIQDTAPNRPIYSTRPRIGIRNELDSSDTLATQVVVVTAAQRTLSFQGTGTVTLTGAHSDSLVGTGVSDIVSLTFTPSAGNLTLTVSGTVEIAQLELGATRTAYQQVVSIYEVYESGQPNVNYAYMDGTAFMYIPSSESELKFMHDGTGAYSIGGWQAGIGSTPAAFDGIFGNRGSVSDVGMYLAYDDTAPESERLSVVASNGASIVFSLPSSDGAMPHSTPAVLSYNYLEGATPNEVLVGVNGVTEISGDSGNSPSSADASFTMKIGAIAGGSNVLTGHWYGDVMVGDTPSDTLKSSANAYWESLIGA